MPLGDSITASVASQASYRYWLDHLLEAGQISFTFVGRSVLNTNGPPKYSDFNPHHEGHSGYATYNFLDPADPKGNDIGSILDANIPDIVLLHLGTNDLFQGRSTAETINGLSQIIDRLRQANPNMRILVAMIIPSVLLEPAAVQQYNQAIAALVAQKNSLDSPLGLVDQYSGFNPTPGIDTYDGTHPNESGEKKMAQRWYTALYLSLQRLPYRQFAPIQ